MMVRKVFLKSSDFYDLQIPYWLSARSRYLLLVPMYRATQSCLFSLILYKGIYKPAQSSSVISQGTMPFLQVICFSTCMARNSELFEARSKVAAAYSGCGRSISKSQLSKEICNRALDLALLARH